MAQDPQQGQPLPLHDGGRFRGSGHPPVRTQARRPSERTLLAVLGAGGHRQHESSRDKRSALARQPGPFRSVGRGRTPVTPLVVTEPWIEGDVATAPHADVKRVRGGTFWRLADKPIEDWAEAIE